MTNGKRVIRTKTPGIKADCLKRAYGAVFPSKECVPKNSLGIYTPDGIYKCKRAVCYSRTNLVLSDCDVYNTFRLVDFGDVATEPVVWGVCGQTATRANELEEKKFLLCYKSGRRFIAKAIVDTAKTPDNLLSVVRVDANKDTVIQFLNGMKAERAVFKQKKSEQQQLKRMRKWDCSFQRNGKKPRFGGDETDSDDDAVSSSFSDSEPNAEPSPVNPIHVESGEEERSSEDSFDDSLETPDESSFASPTENPEDKQLPESVVGQSYYEVDTDSPESPLFESDLSCFECKDHFQRMYYEVFNLPFPSPQEEDESSESEYDRIWCDWENPYH